jgi:hypothetical protein
VREDVVLYMETMAEMLEEKLIRLMDVNISALMESLPEGNGLKEKSYVEAIPA